MPVVQAFWEAANALIPACRFSHCVHVLFAFAPFRVPMASGLLSFEPASGVLNACVEHLIFVNCDDMLSIVTHQVRVACILEEFVHGLFHVSDETLTKMIVAYLYHGIRLNDQHQYCPAQGDSGQGT
jgi:hypothetical protein